MKNADNLKTEAADGIIGAGKTAARLRAFQRANDLSEDISALDDPAVSRLYQMLRHELCHSPDQTKHAPAKEITELLAGQGGRRDVNESSAPDVARFVGKLTRELVNICAKKDMKFLAYLLDMARIEAVTISEARPQD